MKEYKYITLVQTGSTHLYQVRVPEIKDGMLVKRTKKYTSFSFSVNKYTSKKSCIRAAVRKRNAYLRSVDAFHLVSRDTPMKHNTYNRPNCMQTSPRSTSGVIGVNVGWTHKSSGSYYAYVAIWQEKTANGFRGRSRSFSPTLYGECEAFKMACRVRAEMRPPLIITDLDVIPCLADVKYQLQEILND